MLASVYLEQGMRNARRPFGTPLRIIGWWLTGVLFFLLTVAGTAQDRRVLRQSQQEIEMPADIRIQAAAHIGDTTLMVWGFTAATTDSVVPALYMVARRGGAGGDSSVLTSSDARPSDHVVVLPFVDRFLVLWSDLRTDAPGIYCAVISSMGRILVQPEKIGPGMLSRDSIRDAAIIGYPGRTAILVWNTIGQTSSGAYCLKIDGSGTPMGLAMRLEGKFMQAATLGTNDARILVLLDSSARIMDPSGELDPQKITAPIWRAPFFIRQDGVLVMLDQDRLLLYRGIFETVPFRSTPVQIPVSMVVGSATIAPLDDQGVAVDYLTLRTEYSNREIVTLVRLEIDSAGSPRTTSKGMDSLSIYPLITYDTFVAVTPLKAYLAVACNGREVSVLILKVDEAYFRGNGTYYTATYMVKHDAGVDSLDLRADVRDEPLNQCGIFARSTLWPVRTSWVGKSGIALINGKDTLSETIITADGKRTLPERQPCLSLHGDTILVAWKFDQPSLSFRLGHWDGREKSCAVIDSLTPDSLGVPSGHPEFYDTRLQSFQYDTYLVGQGNQIAVIDRQGRTDVISLNMGAAHEEYFSTRFRVFQALPSGWKMVKSLYHESYDHWLTFTFSQWQAGAEPDGNTLGVITSGFVGGFDAFGNRVWQFDTLPSLALEMSAFLPIDDQSFYIATDSALFQIDSKYVTKRASFSVPSKTAKFQRLEGGRILRVLPLDSARRRLLFEIYGATGYKIVQRDLIFDDPVSTFSITEGDWRMIAVVVSGAGGIHATLFSSTLDILAHQVAISATRDSTGQVAAIASGDSLLVTWEDFREGQPALYSAALQHFPQFSGITRNSAENDQAALALSISPNPARDRIHLSIDGGDDIEEISLWDSFGREVLRRTLTGFVSEMSFDSRSLPTGLYRIVVRSSHHGIHSATALVVR